MALKDIIKSITGKKDLPAVQEESTLAPLASDAFPVYKASELDLSRYKKIPLTGLAAMGAAFAQLPEGARTAVQTVSRQINLNETLFVGYGPQIPGGFLKANSLGTVGNIMRVNEQGKQVIAARMRFNPINSVPVTQTTAVVMPVDPVTLAIAVAVFAVDQKLSVLTEKVEEVLQFLKLEKQATQRGNLNRLAEIMDEVKQGRLDEKMCNAHLVGIEAIIKDAHKDIIFYHQKIEEQLGAQKALHGKQQAEALQDQVMAEFCEYQLACYLYAYARMLETVLHGDMDAAHLQHVADVMKSHADRYEALYEQCHAQLAAYQRKAVESVLLGSIGNAAKAVGEKLAAVPVLSKGPVDEALISAGEAMGKHNRDAVAKRLERFVPLADSRMRPFEESVRTLELVCHEPTGMLTDGEHVYVLQSA